MEIGAEGAAGRTGGTAGGAGEGGDEEPGGGASVERVQSIHGRIKQTTRQLERSGKRRK